MGHKTQSKTARYAPYSNCLLFQAERQSCRYAIKMLVFGAMHGPSFENAVDIS